MTTRRNDPLLLSGKVLTLILQGLCGLAGVILFLLIPIVILISQDMLTGFVDMQNFTLLEASPLSFVGILIMLAALLVALSAFFGRMRKIIISVGEGDPFIDENARRLNAMAWLLLGVQALTLLVGFVRVYLANLVSDGGNSLDLSIYDLKGLVMVLVLFILARVFRQGTMMREDLEGTV